MKILARLILPVPVLPAALTFLGALALSLIHSHSLAGWAYADWPATSAEFRQSSTLAGPWVAGCAAWCAGIFASPRNAMCPPCAPRRGWGLVIPQVCTLAACGILGYIAGLGPAILFAVDAASWGRLNFGVAAGGLLLLTCFIAVGYTVGVIVPRVLGVPIAVFAAFATLYLTPAEGSVLAPFYPFDVVAGLVENPAAVHYRLLFFGGATIAALVLASLILNSMRELHVMFAVAAILGVLFATGSLAQGRSLHLVERDLGVTPTCTTAAGATVCVQPAHEAMLRSLARVVTAERDALFGSLGVLEGVEDATLWRSPSPGVVVLQLQGQDRDGWKAFAAQDIASQVSGARACGAQYSGQSLPSDQQPDPVLAAQAVAVWLSQEAGFSGKLISTDPEVREFARRLSLAGPAKNREFVRNSLAKVQSCDGSRSMFP